MKYERNFPYYPVHSISTKAEPFKLWLAEVGKEQKDVIIDPELTIERALETYLKKGYSREWINQRLQAIQVRKEQENPLSLPKVQWIYPNG